MKGAEITITIKNLTNNMLLQFSFTRKLSYSLAVAGAAIALLPQSAAAAIFRQEFDMFQGSFASVTLPLGTQSVATGPISAIQDPLRSSVVTFDDSDNSTLFDLNFILQFPLLTALGLPPLPSNILETGTFQIENNDLIANVSGVGVATGNSPFAGTQIFPTVQWRVTSPLTSSTFRGIIESETVLICPPASACVQTTGDGEATIAATVPEPSVTAGLILFIMLTISLKYQRHRDLSMFSLRKPV